MPAEGTKKEESKKMEEGKEEGKEKETADASPSLPPLEAAARRLERLLGGGLSEKDLLLHSYTNPAKVLRRWLGTASGASGGATLESIAAAATSLLNPVGAGAKGRALLTSAGEAMDTEGVTEEKKYLTSASEREVETWLLSLIVRIYWKEKKFQDAYDLAEKTIAILISHIDVAASNVTHASGPTMASLFPLLARMYRYRSLVAESLTNPQIVASLRGDMIKAHGMASLRRDVDSQATLLNLMLRDLLNASQGTSEVNIS